MTYIDIPWGSHCWKWVRKTTTLFSNIMTPSIRLRKCSPSSGPVALNPWNDHLRALTWTRSRIYGRFWIVKWRTRDPNKHTYFMALENAWNKLDLRYLNNLCTIEIENQWLLRVHSVLKKMLYNLERPLNSKLGEIHFHKLKWSQIFINHRDH